MFFARTIDRRFGMNWRKLRRKTSSALFEEWKAGYRVRPWGDDWQQAAQICIASANPHLKKGIKASDIIPYSKPMLNPMSAEELEAALKAFPGTIMQ